jgi:hypothetical protein
VMQRMEVQRRRLMQHPTYVSCFLKENHACFSFHFH